MQFAGDQGIATRRPSGGCLCVHAEQQVATVRYGTQRVWRVALGGSRRATLVSLGRGILTSLKDARLSRARFCNTMQMMFHESFWAAIATAAPVVALANTVSITDVVNVWLNAKARPRSFISRFYYFVVVFCSALNLILQVIALLIALLCLLVKGTLRVLLQL